jgi:hypothetical protein
MSHPCLPVALRHSALTQKRRIEHVMLTEETGGAKIYDSYGLWFENEADSRWQV